MPLGQRQERGRALLGGEAGAIQVPRSIDDGRLARPGWVRAALP